MKRLTLLIVAVALVFGAVSCKKKGADLLIGTWALETLEYYNIDYQGQPISNTIEHYEFPVGVANEGIDIVFMNNNKGEWRDRDLDVFYVLVSEDPDVYDTIINPDTTVVTPFTYFYDEEVPAVFLKTSDMISHMLEVEELSSTTFSYVNEYEEHYVEHAILKRVDDSKSKSRSDADVKHVARPCKPGSLLSSTSLDK